MHPHDLHQRVPSLSQTQALTAGVHLETLTVFKASAPSQRPLSLPQCSSLHTRPATLHMSSSQEETSGRQPFGACKAARAGAGTNTHVPRHQSYYPLKVRRCGEAVTHNLNGDAAHTRSFRKMSTPRSAGNDGADIKRLPPPLPPPTYTKGVSKRNFLCLLSLA